MNTDDMKLTPIDTAGQNRFDDEYDNTTADLINYGYRNGGIQSEYELAERAQALRELAFKLANRLIDEGYGVSDAELALLVVQIQELTYTRHAVGKP